MSIECSPCDVYLWIESRAINVPYRMDSESAIALNRHSASAEREVPQADLDRRPGWSRRPQGRAAGSAA